MGISRKQFKEKLKTQASEGSSVLKLPLECPLTDLEIPIPGVTAITSENPGEGCTATCIELAVELSRRGPVLYLDFSDSLFLHRLHGADLDNLFIVNQLRDKKDLFSLIHSVRSNRKFSKASHFPYIIVDRFSLFGGKQMGINLKKLIVCLNVFFNPKPTIIVSDWFLKPERQWDYFLELKNSSNKYKDYEILGNLVDVYTSKGTCLNLFIEHVTGRPSRAYHKASTLIKEGKSSESSVFTTPDGDNIQGIWNLVLAEKEKLTLVRNV